MNSPADIWAKVLSLMEGEMTATTINTWFDDAIAVSLDEDRFVLYTPSNFKRDIIVSRYVPAIQKALHELFSADFKVTVLGEGELEAVSRAKPARRAFLPGHRGIHLRALRGGLLQQICPRRRPGGGRRPGPEL